MNNMKHKILMTLALLITAVGGAWAQEEAKVFELNGSSASVGKLTFGTTGITASTVNIHENTDVLNGIKMGNDYNFDEGKYFSIAPETGSFLKGDKVSISICYNKAENVEYAKAVIYADDHETLLYTTGSGVNGRLSAADPAVEEYVLTQDASVLYIGRLAKTATYVIKLKVVRTDPNAIEVTWDAATKTGTFEMPAYDVEIAPIYAPKAKWATEGDKVLAPTAIEGIIAGTEDAIVKAGTVATGQGTAMYFATTDAKMTAEKAAKADGWLSILPTAAGYDDAQTVYVWYYIKGADTPDGQTASAENTFNDSEICATPLTVNVLSNKFDIQFKAANANTIEAGKATVKVGETAATVTDGKLTGVKMDSKVTITAKDGYKFRKVEATKGISTLKSVKIGNYTVYYAEGETWYQAFWRDENKNCGLETSVGRVFTYNDKSLRDSDGDVYADAVIDPSKGYYIAD